MRSRAGRVVIGVTLVVVAVALFVLLKGSSSDDNGGSDQAAGRHRPAGGHGAGPVAVPKIVIRNGKPVGGVTELSFNRGERIRFKVDSDVSDEVHIHGYDVVKDVAAGRPAGFEFPATIEGVFEGELENRGEQILELRVNP